MKTPLITNIMEDTAHKVVPRSSTEKELRSTLEQTKAALRHSEALFQATFDQAAVGMAHATLKGSWIRINRRFCDILGYSAEELLHLPFYELTHPEDRSKDILAIRQLLAGEIPSYVTTKRYLHKAGHTIWVNLTLSLVRDLQGQPDYFVSVIEDITAQKMLQIAEEQQRQFAEALRDSLVALTSTLDVDTVMQQILTSAVTVVPCEAGSIILFEGDHGRVAYLRGYPSEAAAFFQDYSFPLDSLTVGDALRHNRPYLIADTQTAAHWIPLPVTQWVRASVGVPIAQQEVVIGLLILDSATPHHFQAPDIEKLQAFARYASLALENALHASRLEQRVVARTAELQNAKEQVEAILNNSLDAILLIQPDLTIKRSNTVFSTLFTCENKRPPGSLRGYIDEADVARVMASVDTVIHTQTGCQLEVSVHRCDGTVFDAEFSVGPLKDDVLVLILRDVTERKARERQLRFYASLQENVSDAVVTLDLDWHIQSWNQAAETIYGWCAAEVIGHDCARLLQTQLPSGIPVGHLKRNLLEQGHFHGEVIQQHKDGHEIYLLTSATLFKDDKGLPVGIVVVNHDISERKRAEDALLQKMEEERIFQAYLKTLHEITIELTQLDWLDDFYKRAVELGLERLGFERLGLLLYDAEHHIACGSYGTDPHGKVIAEPHIRLPLGSYGGRLQRALESSERFCFDEHAALYSNFEVIGFGWNAMTVLRHGPQVLGWLCADNGIQHKPVSKPQLEILALYSLSLSTLLARKLVMLALRESEGKFRQVVKAAPVAIVISNDAGQITLVNDRAELLFGYTSADLLGHPVEMLVPEALDTVHTAHRKSYLTGRKVGQAEEKAELYALRQDGTLFPVEIKLSHIETVDGLMVMSFLTDISERKAAERALREQRDFLQLVIDTIPDFIAVKDQNGRFQLANRRIADIYGTTPTALIGKYEMDIHAEQSEIVRFQAQDQQALLSGQPVFISEDAFGDNYYQINVIPLKNRAGAFDRLLVVGSDITGRKRAEEALQQALKKEKELGELKSRFVSMASHEFRTPLTSITVLTETLSHYRHKLTDEQIAQRLNKIQDQVGHLKTIMDDVLQLARIQARRMEFNPTPVDLDELCSSVVEEFLSQPTTAQRLRYHHDTPLPLVNLDKRLMRQIISNLLSNALKYSAIEKPVKLQLAYTGGAVVLQVSDEGIGIPTDDLKHLFQPFHRANNVGTISGTGLGLSITKESVELHGGTIVVNSELGVGTTFTVTLPTTASKVDEQTNTE